MTTPNRKRRVAKNVKAHHDRRRDEKICINNKAHGPAFKAGRCRSCYDANQATKKKKPEEPSSAPSVPPTPDQGGEASSP